MLAIRLIPGDCRDALADLEIEGVQADGGIMDPPYHLESIQKRFGSPTAAPAQGGDGRFSRLSGGFMGKSWDGSTNGYRIAFDVALWRAVYRVLKPGAYLFVFGSPRTGHRMACAIEDAGFIMHPFHVWAYAQGFPKAHSAAAAGPEWEGYYTGAATFNPAVEPIYMAQKPFSTKTGVENIVKHGVGGINIEALRVPTEDDLNGGAYAKQGNRKPLPGDEDGSGAQGLFQAGKTTGKEFVQPPGRWPSNLVHDGSDEVVGLLGGRASNFETVHFNKKANKADRAGSEHPTVKPVDLLRRLVRAVIPPGGLVLDAFAGTGTTGEAAVLEGRRAILMEAEVAYLADIERRVYALEVKTGTADEDIL